MNEHVFEISKDICDALTAEEVEATVRDLKRLGIYRLPYNDPIRIIFDLYSWTELERDKDDKTVKIVARCDGSKPDMADELFYEKTYPSASYTNLVQKITQENGHNWERVNNKTLARKMVDKNEGDFFYRDILIAVLASKGTVKITKRNKLANLGIGKNNAASVTTIRLSGNLAYDEGFTPGQGRPMRAHFRRGHDRKQHYGPQNTMIKDIFIEPTFVNGDPEFFTGRTKYRIKI
jgi:hypothetical protein